MKQLFKKTAALAVLMAAGLAQAQQPTEIVVDYAYADLFKEVHESIARDFMAKFPQYKVTFRAPNSDYEVSAQQVLRQAVTGQLPDVSYQGLNRQRVFADRGLTMETRGDLAEALVDSRNFYNAGTWPRLNASEFRKAETGIMRVYRAVVQPRKPAEGDWLSNQEVIEAGAFVRPNNLLVKLRLMLFVRLLVAKPASLFMMLAASYSPLSQHCP